MQRLETFLTDPRFALDGPYSLADLLPFAVMAVLLALALRGATKHWTRVEPGQPKSPYSLQRLRDWTGMPLDTPLGRAAFFIFGGAYLLLFLMALAVTFILLGAVIFGGPSPMPGNNPRASFGLGALLVALLGAPFLIWRSVVAQKTLDATQKQTELQDEAQFNDKINAAATDLAARREVTKIVEQDGKEVVLTEWQDDLVTRAAAIDRLEGLALEAFQRRETKTAERIARLLSIYVRELSETAKPLVPPVDIWDDLATGTEHQAPLNADQIYEFTGIDPDALSEDHMLHWAMSLRPARRDMERAAQSLGRILPGERSLYSDFNQESVNLSSCNLQAMDLRGLNFEGALFRDANLIGTKLSGTSLRNADLRRADMRWANLGPSEL